jgi:hypothetical protein
MIKCFLSLLLLMYCITFMDLCLLNDPCITWDVADLVMVNDLSATLLDLFCHYFIEGFCMNVH